MTNEQLAMAKIYIADGQGLQQAALKVGVLSRELDAHLWKALGVPASELVPVKLTWTADF